MPRRSFHHGNLRAALLEHAETVLRERGIEALSLRELAREAGVSHGAPRSHFIDRTALIDALAARGFTRLSEDLGRAAATCPDDWFGRMRAAGAAYLAFATHNAALHDLMFAAKVDHPSEPVREAAATMYAALNEVLRGGAVAGTYPEDEMQRLGMLLMLAMRGTASMVASRQVSPEHGLALLEDAITVLVSGVSGASRAKEKPGP